MALINGAEALVRCLIEEGVRYVFGVPGDQCNPITDAIYRLGRESGLKFVTARHEQAAAHMADAWARVTGEPGVCLGTVGPGVADLVPGVYTAWADSVPMVVLGTVGLLWLLPTPDEFFNISPLLNWGSAFLMVTAVYYFIISVSLAIGMLPFILGVASFFSSI